MALSRNEWVIQQMFEQFTGGNVNQGQIRRAMQLNNLDGNVSLDMIGNNLPRLGASLSQMGVPFSNGAIGFINQVPNGNSSQRANYDNIARIDASQYNPASQQFAQQPLNNPQPNANQVNNSYQPRNNVNRRPAPANNGRSNGNYGRAQQGRSVQSSNPYIQGPYDIHQRISLNSFANRLAPFMSENELNALKTQAGNQQYSGAVINKALYVLQHFNDTGADYTVQVDPRNKSRINVVVADTQDKMRLLTDTPNEVGYAILRDGTSLNFEGDHGRGDPALLVDYITGNIRGKSWAHLQSDRQRKKTSVRRGAIFLTNPRTGKRYPYHLLHTTKYTRASRRDIERNITNNNQRSAKDYLSGLIKSTKGIYAQQILGEDASGVDRALSTDQKRFNKFVTDNDIQDADVQAAKKIMVARINGKNPQTQVSSTQQKVLDEIGSLTNDRVGSYDNGFDPNVVVNMQRQNGNYVTNSLWTALNMDHYPTEKIVNNDNGKEDGDPEALNKTKDHMIQFDADHAVSNTNAKSDDPKVQVANYVAEQLQQAGVQSTKGGMPKVLIDNHGIVRWQGMRTYYKSRYDSYSKSYKMAKPHNQPLTSNNTRMMGEPIQGEIGQIFIPDKNGIIHTNFASGKNFNLVPGKKGWFQYKGIDKGVPRMKRFRVRGYREMLAARIHESINSQLMRPVDVGLMDVNQARLQKGDPVMFNDLTSARDDEIIDGLYTQEAIGKRLPDHWMDNSLMTDAEKKMRLETWQNRIALGKRYSAMSEDMNRDGNNGFTKLVDGKKMSNLPQDYRNYFDMNLTSGGKQQGVVLYLAQGTALHQNADGTTSVEPVQGKRLAQQAKAFADEYQKVTGKSVFHRFQADPSIFTARAPIGYLPELMYLDNMPWDRKSVAEKYALNEAYSFAPKTRVAYMTFGGDNFEDSTVVSKKFAEAHKVPDRGIHNQIQYNKDGSIKMRPLKTGDKIDDFGHNKATIGQVIDPDMDPKEAKLEHLSREVAIFHKNPDLNVVMSPHSLITRGNGAVAQAMGKDKGKHVEDVIDPDTGKVLGQSGIVPFMITKLTSDKQSTDYDSYNINRGKERKFSSQMDWGAMSARYRDPKTGKIHPCGYHILNHVFRHSARNLASYREYMLATGMDLDRAGRPKLMGGAVVSSNGAPHSNDISYFHPQEHRQKYVFTTNEAYKKAHPGYKFPKDADSFLRELGSHGGTLELPFTVKMKSGVQTNELPIMSSHLRSNMTLQNGETQINDYNKLYAVNNKQRGKDGGPKPGIFADVITYEKNQRKQEQRKQLDAKDGVNTDDDKELAKVEQKMNTSRKDAQKLVTKIGTKVEKDELGGPKGTSFYNKHSFMRDHLMSTPIPHSATAVAQNDMRLPLDTIAVSPHIYKTLFKDAKPTNEASGHGALPKGMYSDPKYQNKYVWLHRDPVISPGSIRGFKVVEDKKMGEGFKMNPVNANSFAGDFDGDTYGLANIGTKDKGVQEDLKHLSVPYQLVDNSGASKASFLDASTDFISGGLQSGVLQPQIKKDGKHNNLNYLKKKGYDPKVVKSKNPDNKSPKDQLQDKLLAVANKRYDEQGRVTTDSSKVNEDVTMYKRAHDSMNLVNKCMRNDFGAAGLNPKTPMTNYQSVSDIVKSGAKGKPVNVRNYMDHYKNEAKMTDMMMSNAAQGKHVTDRHRNMNNRLKQLSRMKGDQQKKAISKLSSKAVPNQPLKDEKGNLTLRGKFANTTYLTVNQKHEPNTDMVMAFNSNATVESDQRMQNALAAKSFDTAAAGTVPQKLMSAIGDRYPRLVLQMTNGATQANLSGKHHKDRIPKIHKMLHTQIPNLLNGYDANSEIPSIKRDVYQKYHGKDERKIQLNQKLGEAREKVYQKYPKEKADKIADERYSDKPLTPKKWSVEFRKVYHGVHVDLNKNKTDMLANVLAGADYKQSDNGHYIQTKSPQKNVMSITDIKAQSGNPTMDTAYTGNAKHPGGYGNTLNLARHNSSKQAQNNDVRQKSFADGKAIKHIYPKDTRYYNEHPDKLEKANEQDRAYNEGKAQRPSRPDPMIKRDNMSQFYIDEQNAERRSRNYLRATERSEETEAPSDRDEHQTPSSSSVQPSESSEADDPLSSSSQPSSAPSSKTPSQSSEAPSSDYQSTDPSQSSVSQPSSEQDKPSVKDRHSVSSGSKQSSESFMDSLHKTSETDTDYNPNSSDQRQQPSNDESESNDSSKSDQPSASESLTDEQRAQSAALKRNIKSNQNEDDSEFD